MTTNLFIRLKTIARNDLNWLWLIVGLSWISFICFGHDHSTMHHSMYSSAQGAVYHAHAMTHHVAPLHRRIIFELSAWQTMTIAMMLPSTIPMMQKFSQISASKHDQHQSQFAFLFAYFVVWTGFAIVMIAVGHLIKLPQSQLWMPQPLVHSINALSLIGAGLFQFTPMKQSCLSGCRSTAMMILQHYQPGYRGGWAIGVRHALFCLGCCWALMVASTVLGMQNLTNMLVFSAIMTLERSWKYGERFAVWVGAIMIAWGIGMFSYQFL